MSNWLERLQNDYQEPRINVPAHLRAEIEAGKWGWLGVKRFQPELYPTLEERYAALEAHHQEETKALVEFVKVLAQLASELP